MEVVFIILNILKIVFSLNFQTFFSKFVFHGGHIPDFHNFEFFGLYWTSPTIVTKHVLLISSYLGHLPVRSSSMEVVFRILKILKIVLGSTGLVLQMLQSMLYSFPAI
jgi:hypothetical protein